MTQPVQEPSQGRVNQALEFRSRQLFRRPAVVGAAQFDIKVVADTDALTTGDGKFIFAIPSDLNGYALVSAEAYVTTVSSSGLPTVQIRNISATADMLSTRITIDVGDYTSYAAATPSVVNTANAGVSTGDRVAVDVDVKGTGSKGLGVILGFA